MHSLIIIYVHNWSNVSSGSDMMITDGSAVHSTQPNAQEAEGAAGRTAWLVWLSVAIWVKIRIRSFCYFFFPVVLGCAIQMAMPEHCKRSRLQTVVNGCGHPV